MSSVNENKPLILKSPTSDKYYLVTKYKKRGDGVLAIEKLDITDQISDLIIRERIDERIKTLRSISELRTNATIIKDGKNAKIRAVPREWIMERLDYAIEELEAQLSQGGES